MAQASGATRQVGWSVWTPGNAGPLGVGIWYGLGGGVGSAWAVPAVTTMAATAAAAIVMFLTMFIASTFLVGECPRWV